MKPLNLWDKRQTQSLFCLSLVPDFIQLRLVVTNTQNVSERSTFMVLFINLHWFLLWCKGFLLMYSWVAGVKPKYTHLISLHRNALLYCVLYNDNKLTWNSINKEKCWLNSTNRPIKCVYTWKCWKYCWCPVKGSTGSNWIVHESLKKKWEIIAGIAVMRQYQS